MHIDQRCLYSESHEWTRQDDDLWTVGISDYSQESLGNIVFIELPEPGAQVARGGVLAVVESAKAASDLYSPVGGQVVVVNTHLAANPGLLNTDPFGNGWIAKIRPSAQPQVDPTLRNSTAYGDFCQSLTK